ncbi:O-antigen polymerase [Chryseobacterium indoltheticum]|uniref:O-antigen polysaccharide polymerase Wzy n=1 Tax=Chryseobacterium indoltheticum TaxID=254 RepID=A0A3G6N4T3_9FLAO|nr:O-antigen polymerase [Chryseobacterium indoltheticum]AZA62754.1 O-antigen polysaccharide polymerase Wzy [Chryseobacterium indoltheticum]
MQILSLLLAIILFFLAPNKYDFFVCCIIFCLFIYTAVITIKNSSKKESVVNFSLFFTISFFFVNFFYPVFIYPVDKYYFPVFGRFYFNEAVITKSTALALIGYCSFSIGTRFFQDKSNIHDVGFASNIFVRSKLILKYTHKIILISAWVVCFFIFFLAKDGILKRSSDAFFNIEPYLLVISQCLINLLIILNFYLKKNIRNLAIAVIYAFVFIYVGDRGPAIQTGLVLLFSYNIFYKKISRSKIILIFIAGFIGLTLVSALRGKDGNNRQFNDVEFTHYYDFTMDLIVNNRNLYAGYDYVDKNGVNYGQSSISYLFAPIPLLPSFITTNLYGVTPQQLSTGTILTNDVNATWGLGTNLIADIYMQFGFLGVIILMFFLGNVISKLALNRKRKLFVTICYIFISSFSIYMARSSLFDSVRYIAWAAMIYYFLFYLFKPFLKAVK